MNKINLSDKIMVRKPDGSFAVLEVENDEALSSKQTAPAASSSSASFNKDIKSKDFFSPSSQASAASSPPGSSSQAKKSVAAEEAGDDDQGFTWEGAVDEVIKALPADLQGILKKKDDSWNVRLRNIILSRLRDVRDWLTTKEALTKSWNSGGLGLSEAEVAGLLNIIEAQHKKIHTRPIAKVKETPSPFGSDVTDLYRSPETISALVESDILLPPEKDGYKEMLASHLGLKNKAENAPVQPEDKEVSADKVTIQEEGVSGKADVLPSEEPAKKDKPTEKADLGEEVYVSDKEFSPPNPEAIQKKATVLKTPSFASQPESVVRPLQPTKPSNNSKPVLEDVRYDKRLVGPIDELRNMRLLDFRRLGSTTDERLDRIYDKIMALEEESFQKKVEGIKAWRQSPLYRKYLSVGNESLEKNISIEQVIANNLNKSSDELTLEEFNRITDFNKQLRY